MTFSGSGFGGFGSANNNQSSFGGGGFGSTNNTSGFGQQNNTGFGSTSNNTSSGFGGFGSSNTAFGAAKPTFGSTTTSSGSLFGSTTATTGGGFGGGGFGATNTASTGFGGGNSTAGGTLFGQQNKPASAFGGSGGGMFGGGTTGSAFGSNNNNNNTTSTGGLFGGGGVGTALGASVPESQGTASTPYQPTTEKETNSSTVNNFQSITMQQPYSKYSFEELRIGDYNAGRRFANASGQAGTFGASTGFGGFGNQNPQTQATGFAGNTGSSLFGGANSTAGPGFGGNTSTVGAFGNNNAFGAKPAGSLFGSTPTTGQSSGGIFGTTGGASFGQQNSNAFGNTQNTASPFGQNNTQQKPGSIFGSTNNTGNAFGGGAATNTGFGSGGGLFAQQNQTQPQNSSPFGQNQQQQNATPFGQAAVTNTGFGAFGNNANNNQQKPNTLFGSTGTGQAGGLFGNNTQSNQQQGSVFGSTNNATGGGLFGNPNNTNNNATNSLFAPKPATGPSLFGNTQPNQQNATNPFGQAPTQQDNTSGLFGNSQQKPLGTGGGLFGNTTQQPANSSLFGNTAVNQNPGGSLLGNSLFGNQQQQPNTLQPPQGLSASITDPNPYGSISIFNGLPPPPQTNPGPISTPIYVGQKQKKPAVLPQYRLNPAMSARYVTPQRRGYGFSYSTYGTPQSAMSSASTPGGLSASLLSGSIGRNLGKSFSTSNLRRNYDADGDSILSPGAFTASSSRFSQHGSMKKLTIDRTLRSDLFGTTPLALPSTEKSDPKNSASLKKRVSFDATAVGGNVNSTSEANGTAESSGALPDGTANGELSPTPSAQEQGYLRSSSRMNLFSGKMNGARRSQGGHQPESSQVRGNELAIVHEDGSLEESEEDISRALANRDLTDPEPGAYWTEPPMAELKRMSRDRLKKIEGFRVGRERCGECQFKAPVDLTTVDLDNFFGHIADITIRSCTIYTTTANKPPQGRGLNVPARITLENSWPRSRNKRDPLPDISGPAFEKHVQRLKGVRGTTFIAYDKKQGAWTFEVPHFTTYALDYEDDENEADPNDSSGLSDATDPPTPTPRIRQSRAGSTPAPAQSGARESSMLTDSFVQPSSEPDDTFEFKKRRVPGEFDEAPAVGEDEPEMEDIHEDGQPFLAQRSAVQSDDDWDEPSEIEPSGTIENQSLIDRAEEEDNDVTVDMVGSFPEERGSRSILQNGSYDQATPLKALLDLHDDWAAQLQRTISPRKRDRQALKDSQALLFHDADLDMHVSRTTKSPKMDGGEITNSIDLMKSLFGKEEMRRSVQGTGMQEARKGFQWPYPKKSDPQQPEMSEVERDFHNSFKPTWGPGGVLIHATHNGMVEGPPRSHQVPPMDVVGSIASEHYDIRFSKFSSLKDRDPRGYATQLERTFIEVVDGVPFARPAEMSYELSDKPAGAREERLIWELSHILFDDYDDAYSEGLTSEDRTKYEDRIRKDRLSAYWSQLCRQDALEAVRRAQSPEERAIAYLSMNAVVESCNALAEGKDYRLATLVAQIGGDKTMHEDMAEQIQSWKQLNVLSEMNEPIRALYELLSGNVCVCEGKRGAVEDRIPTFTISSRFNLSWTRAFGLRLWYAILDDQPIEAAVQAFLDDLSSDSEPAKPKPRFMSKPGYKAESDSGPEKREDVLWGILRIYTEAKTNSHKTRLADVLVPENLTGNPVDYKLAFELYHALSPVAPIPGGGDRLSLAFAEQLEGAGLWLWALFALLHVGPQQPQDGTETETASAARAAAVKDLLGRQADKMDVDGDESIRRELFDVFRIPAAWVYEAKALHARAVEGDAAKEVRFLQKAESWEEAHRVLCATVAPRAVVEREYGELGELLRGFEEARGKVHEWRAGGAAYRDYLALLERGPGDEKQRLLGRLLRSLPELAHAGKDTKRSRGRKGSGVPEKGSGSEAFLSHVAAKEMGWVVGDMVLADRENERDHALVLQLPLTREMRHERSRDLGLEYYRKLMAVG